MNYTITGLLSSTTYQYRVATNCAGTLSTYLPIQTFTTLPMRLANEVITDEKYVELNPNPASSLITISFESISESRIEIMDMTGRIVYSQNGIVANQFNVSTIDVSNFDAGIYLVHVAGEGMDITKKLVVSN
ncbi:MAG: T9SS type A sorting domain-containing protein [Chitinophagales bacterium]